MLNSAIDPDIASKHVILKPTVFITLGPNVKPPIKIPMHPKSVNGKAVEGFNDSGLIPKTVTYTPVAFPTSLTPKL